MSGLKQIIKPLAYPALLAVFFLHLFSAAMLTGLNHDEYQFVASGQLMACCRLLPYVDYPYLHMPYLTALNALLFVVTDHHLLAARAFQAFCASLSGLFIFHLSIRELHQLNALWAWLGAGLLTLLYLTDPLLLQTNGRAWNHMLPTLLALAACTLALPLQTARPHNTWRWLVVGLLVAAASGTRLSYAALLPVFGIAAWFQDHSKRAIKTFIAGSVLAITPILGLALAAPWQFYYGNLVYIRLNTAYRLAQGSQEAMNLPAKAVFFFQRILSDPFQTLFYLLTLAATLLFLYTLYAHRGKFKRHSTFLVSAPAMPSDLLHTGIILSSAWVLFASAFAPTPSWYQYFFAPLPFLLLSGLRLLVNLKSRWLLPLATFTVVILFLLNNREVAFESWAGLQHPENWLPVKVHNLAKQLKTYVPSGRILTLVPSIPLEAGLQVYPHFTSGTFMWRTSTLLSPEYRQRYSVLSPAELPALLSAQPPDGILLGFGEEETTFRRYAEEHQYQLIELSSALPRRFRPRLYLPED